MVNTIALVLAGITLGLATFAASLVLLRDGDGWARVPLAAVLILLCIIASPPLYTALAPDHRAIGVLLLLPAYLSLGPLFWFYVLGLTEETPWQPKTTDLWHFLPPLLGVMVVILTLVLPPETRDSLIVEGNDQALFVGGDREQLAWLAYLVMFAFALILGWLLQTAYYMYRVIYRLRHYRARLRDLFASNERRELSWILGVLIIVGGLWLVAIVALVLENFTNITLLSTTLRATLVLLVTWLIALWGLRQRPGFEGRYQRQQDKPDVTAKYQRSALDLEQSLRIAEKIEQAMKHDHLYLQSELTLATLAEHLNIPSSYVSQTLNQTMQETFYDYVNRYRIEAAKPKILNGEEAIIDIALAVGFNARSTFYTSFRRVTGQTPAAFRKSTC